MRNSPFKAPRPRIRYVSPRFQGPAVLAFAVIVVTWGVIFWKLVDGKFQRVFLHASVRGHYKFDSAYDIVRDLLVLHLAGLFVGVFLAGAALALLLIAATRHGLGKAVESLRVSAGGDLSTPTGACPLGELKRFGGKIDAARSDTLVYVLKIRSEAAALAAGGISPEEFRLRWDELKQWIRGIAP